MGPHAPPPLDADRFALRVDPRPPPGPRAGATRRAGAIGATRLSFARTALASALIIGILVAFAREEEGRAGREAGIEPASAAASPAGSRLPTAAEPVLALEDARAVARLHPDGSREDAIVVGAWEGVGPHGRFVLRRGAGPVPADETPVPFFVDLAREAASVGIGVARSGRPASVATKFGPAEVADAVLSGGAGPDGGADLAVGIGRTCPVIRLSAADGLRLVGWLCGTPERPATAAILACLVDRLTAAPGADPALVRLFAQAERRRLPACEPPRAVAATPDGIPAELFLQEAAPPSAAPKAGRSRRRERS